MKRVAYLAEAHDPTIHYPLAEVSPDFVSEVAFIGKVSRDDPLHAKRSALLPPIAERFDTRLYGKGWQEIGLSAARDEIYPDQYREICRSAGIVLGCDWRHDCTGYFSNRTWFTLGCRGFLLTNYVPGLEEVFANHGHLVWYESTEECVELVDHYRKRPEERARVAAAGHELVLAHRTYDAFARDLALLFQGPARTFPPVPSPRTQPDR